LERVFLLRIVANFHKLVRVNAGLNFIAVYFLQGLQNLVGIHFIPTRLKKDLAGIISQQV
jgi:hypothetical protein